jgi:glycosyltransferase involved in cell wall biosynthesis
MMKVVLVLLSGDAAPAESELAKQYPGAVIETVSRAEIESGSLVSRIAALRSRHADVLAFVTERLAWQRRQDLFMLLGALAGARVVMILDRHGASRRETRSSILLRAPFKTVSEGVFGARTVARARSELQQLEAQVKSYPGTLPTEAGEHGQRRIVYLRSTPGPGTQAGGAASHIKGVTDALIELGTQVRFISNDDIAGLDDEAKLSIIGPEPLGGTRAVFEIHNNSIFTAGAVPLIVHDPPDFIYQRYARFGWAGVVASLRSGRPLFLEYNGSEVWVGRHWDHVGMLDLLARYERLNLDAAVRIFVVSDVERLNLERAGVQANKIIVNPNGVDIDTFRPGIGGERVRDELGIAEAETLVGFVGSFGPWHGVLTLVEAIKEIPASSGVRFLLVGSGSLLAQVKQLLSNEEQEGRVIFTGGVGHEQVPRLLDACDVLASPHIPLADDTEFFGSPTKIFEYMAMGKGIVASRLGQIGEVLSDGESALLVEPGNTRELTEAIVRLGQSPELREHLGENARRHAIERHTWKRNAQNVLDAYRNWLEEVKS